MLKLIELLQEIEIEIGIRVEMIVKGWKIKETVIKEILIIIVKINNMLNYNITITITKSIQIKLRWHPQILSYIQQI